MQIFKTISPCLFLIALLFFLPNPAHSAVITVNNTSHNISDDGFCSLREAITSANTDTASGALAGECAAGDDNDDTIEFNLSGCPCSIRPTNSYPTITESVIIQGPGADQLTIDPISSNRIFNLLSSGNSQTLTLRDLSLNGGNQSVSTGGGAVRISDTTDSLIVERCSFDNNTGFGGGGSLEFRGINLTVVDSNFEGSNTTNGGGGAIAISTSGATVDISGCTISDNDSDISAGGGIFVNDSGGGVVSISNSTISGNRSAFDGGGIYLSQGTLNLNNVTIFNNTADQNNDGAGGGGGIYGFGGADAFNVSNSIISNNTDRGGQTPDCEGTIITSLDYNILGDSTGCAEFNGANDQVDTDPLLINTLQFIGGLTPVHRLLTGSPALDMGNPAGCKDALGTDLTVDQRGFVRPVGARCDVGAVEFGTCGDGGFDEGEECDDGGDNSDTEPDACRTNCMQRSCGDGVVDTGEACDDGNAINDDACRNNCSLPSCGDSVTDPGEDCDDGNTVDTDDCIETCLNAQCGDGFIQSGVEACDDGNNNDSDSCHNDCSIPMATPIAISVCGDGTVDAGETCDDGNTTAGDGCSATCQTEAANNPQQPSGGCSLVI